MNLEKELLETIKLIKSKKQELKNIKKELSELNDKQYSLTEKINEKNSIKFLQNFINKNGSTLNKKLHNELRLELIKILYKNIGYVTTYDMVLKLILERLNVKYKYLDETDGNTKWNLLKIEL